MMSNNNIHKLLEEEGNHEEWHYERNPKYKCCIERNTSMGIWCGYVAVPKGHPVFGMHYDNVDDVDVHGGLTYADNHFPNEEEQDDYWVLGFDCGHSDDAIPLMGGINESFARSITNLFEGQSLAITYKNKTWVINETNQLAEQLLDIEKKKQ